MAKKNLSWNGTNIGTKAEWVDFDNSGGNLTATNVQDAIDELSTRSGSSSSSSASPYLGKRLGCIGDSFTANGLWLAKLQTELGLLEVKNEAVSGGSWVADSNHTNLSAFKRAQVMYSDYNSAGTEPDYILIVDGVNDVGNSATLGDIVYTDIDDVTNSDEDALVSAITSTYDLDTFTGGAQAALSYIAVRFPNAIVKIGWTPAGQQYMRQRINSNGWDVVNAYIDRLKQLATMYGVQYIDSINAGICPWIVSNRNNYQVSSSDGHPSSAANQRIGEYMARLLKSNL